MLHNADRGHLDGRHCFRIGHVAAANCGYVRANTLGPGCDTISRTDLDLGRGRQRHINRIRSQGEAEATTQGRFVAEAIRIVGAFLLEQGVSPA